MNQVVRGLSTKWIFDQEAHIVEVDATDDIEGAPYKYVNRYVHLCSLGSNPV